VNKNFPKISKIPDKNPVKCLPYTPAHSSLLHCVEIFQNRNSALVSECTLYDFVPKMVSSLLLLKLILNLCVTIPADNHEVPFTQLQSTKYTTKHYVWFTVSFMHENTSYTSPHTGVPTRLQPYIRVPKLVTPTSEAESVEVR
jgi:hypothetical protein